MRISAEEEPFKRGWSTVSRVLQLGTFWFAQLRGTSRLPSTRPGAERPPDQFKAIVDDAPMALGLADESGRIRYANRAFEHLLGFDAASLVGTTGLEMVHPDDAEACIAFSRAIREASGPIGPITLRLRHRDGTWRRLELIGNAVSGGTRERWVVLGAYDTTRQHVIEEELTYQALHDPLTGLPNRVLFRDRLSHALSGIVRQSGYVAVLFVDLDDFKVVNDRHGHDVGDRLLMHVAQCIEACLRPCDTATRWGGDEFTILLDNLEHAGDADEIAARLVTRLADITLDAPQAIAITASIGIALSGPQLKDPDELIRLADAAMYQAKRRGKATTVLYEDLLNRVR